MCVSASSSRTKQHEFALDSQRESEKVVSERLSVYSWLLGIEAVVWFHISISVKRHSEWKGSLILGASAYNFGFFFVYSASLYTATSSSSIIPFSYSHICIYTYSPLCLSRLP